MEANFVLKASDLTADFAEGLRKVFSNNATLHIRVDFGNESASAGSTDSSASSGEPSTGKRRGRKPGIKVKSAAPSSSEGPKKRGRKPGFKMQNASAASSEGPKKRGRKPKNQAA